MNFQELDDILIEAGAGSRASECHGFLCGYSCVSSQINVAVLEEYLFAGQDDPGNTIKCHAIISALAQEIHTDLNSENFSLQLLLPDEDTSLEVRCESLIEWCESFLSGLGVGGLTGLNELTKESIEIIEDIQKICRLDPENFSGNTNEEERAFMELTEYVRMGVLLLYEEIQNAGGNEENPEILH